MALRQIFADRKVIGKISVMDKCGVDAFERMGASRVPDPAFSWETLVRDPDVSAKVIDLIILCYRFSISDYLKNHDIFAFGKDECLLFTERSVKFLIQPETILMHKLAFSLITVELFEPVFSYK